MARLSDDPVTVEDLKRYLSTFSDFAFEVAVLKLLTDSLYACRHAGTYDDPLSGKTRQYDIHAEVDVPTAGHIPVYVRLAVECKNIGSNYPLILHRVPRRRSEAFVDVVWSDKPDHKSFGPPRYRYGERVRLREGKSPYPIGEYVGKSADQVGKRPNGDLQAADHEVFDRINQASHSAYELLRASHYAGLHAGEPVVSLVIPVLVIPKGRLWAVDYAETGAIVNEPTNLSQATYFLDREWTYGTDQNEFQAWYSLSHLHIVEFDALVTFVAHLIRGNAGLAEVVNDARLEELRRKQARSKK